jgi:flagellar capping protein FliD
MSENEIKLWEEKSKQGLLHNDSAINSFLSDMRSAMYTKGDSSYILSNFGIDSSKEWQDRGKLVIDEDRLKDALKNNADEVTKFFTSEKGLAVRLNDICKKTANTSSGSRGSLVIRAGVKGKATEKDNEIYDQLQTIKDKLEKLNKKYETRKERLWKQFNAMETALSKANSQSDYFANYM